MRERRIDLTQLRRVILFANQLVEELRALEKSATGEDRLTAGELAEAARELADAVEESAHKWRPMPILEQARVRAQLRTMGRGR
jgi:hypothetical protein